MKTEVNARSSSSPSRVPPSRHRTALMRERPKNRQLVPSNREITSATARRHCCSGRVLKP